MPKHIVVVEDDAAILEVVKIILEDKGYQVTLIQQGENALQDIPNLNPDLILLDIWISGFDGREITQALKKNPKTKHIPIVVISAHNDAKHIAKDAGAEDFLAKPFDLQDLVTIVGKYATNSY